MFRGMQRGDFIVMIGGSQKTSVDEGDRGRTRERGMDVSGKVKWHLDWAFDEE